MRGPDGIGYIIYLNAYYNRKILFYYMILNTVEFTTSVYMLHIFGKFSSIIMILQSSKIDEHL